MPPRASSVTAGSADGNAAATGSERPTPDPQIDQETSTDGGGPLNDLDPLAQQELEAFGADAEEETLPRPPRDPNGVAGAQALAAAGTATPTTGAASSGPTAAAPGIGGKRSLAASAEPLARAKRPKSVKISPAKMGKQFARRAAAPGTPGEYSLPNHDYCDSCGGKGQFLCCEGGCLRSFHFTCLEPPLELEEVPEDESWYCKSCRAAAHPPPRPRAGFFSELIFKVETENPKQFSLPNELKGYFKNVAVGTNGEFIDSFEHRPPSKITGRAIGQEDRDGYRLKDKNGRPIICYNCDEGASAAKRRRIISCDFCDQHWHLDCLDPPMSGMPPPTRKWMCPVHADHLIPRTRQTKSTTTQTIDRPYRPNNGDIVILPHQEASAGGEVEEMTVNRVRYQLPEQTVVLDFWNRVTGQKVSSSGSKKLGKARVPRKRSAGYDSGDLSSLSELTSSDESEGEGHGSRSRRGASTSTPASALDHLALLAEVRYVDLLNSQQQQGTGVLNGTPGRDKSKAPIRDLPPALPNSIQRRGPRPSAPAPAPGAKRPSIGGTSGPSSSAAPGTTPSAAPTSRGASPSLSPAPRSSELVVESKEDLQAIMRVRKLTKARDAEGEQWRSTLFGFLEGEAILPKLGFIKSDSTPWQRPWEQRRAGAAGPEKNPTAGPNGTPSAESPATSPAVASASITDPLQDVPAASTSPEAEPVADKAESLAAGSESAQQAPAPAPTVPGGPGADQAGSTPEVTKSVAADADLPFSLPTSARPASASSGAVKAEEDAMDVDAAEGAAAGQA